MKRVLAWIGIVVLLFCYLMTFISAFFTNSSSHGWFSASVAATIIVPCFMYAYFMLAKTLDNRKQEELVREAQFRARMEALKQQKLKEKEAQEHSEKTTQELERLKQDSAASQPKE